MVSSMAVIIVLHGALSKSIFLFSYQSVKIELACILETVQIISYGLHYSMKIG